MAKRRSTVTTSGAIPEKGRPRLWAFGYADFARLFGVSDAVVRSWVSRKRFDPSDLRSIVRFASEELGRHIGAGPM